MENEKNLQSGQDGGLRKIFTKINPDSLAFLNAEVEYSQQQINFFENKLQNDVISDAERASYEKQKLHWQKEHSWNKEKLRNRVDEKLVKPKQAVNIVRTSSMMVQASEPTHPVSVEAELVNSVAEGGSPVMYGQCKARKIVEGVGGNGRPNPVECADLFCRNIPHVTFNNGIYVADVVSQVSTFKVFRLLPKDELLKFLNRLFHGELVEYKDPIFLDKIKRCIEISDGMVINELSPLLRDRVVFRNGFLSISSNIFSPVADGVFCPFYLDLDYDGYPHPCPIFDQFLHQIAGNDLKLEEYILELLAMAIVPDYTFKGFVVIQGKGNTGKSTLMRVLASLFPDNLVGGVTLQQMEGRFGPVSLCGNAINISDEAGSVVKEKAVVILKALTSGVQNKLGVEYKGKDIWFMRPYIKLFVACNPSIHWEGASDAFFERVYTIPCQYKLNIVTNGQDLGQLLYQERLGVVQRLINARRRYIQRGGFEIYFAPNSVVDSDDRVQETSRLDCIRKWGILTLISSPGSSVRVEELRVEYNRFCVDNGWLNQQVSQTADFSKALRTLGYKVESAKVVKTGERPRSAIVDYRLRDQKGGE